MAVAIILLLVAVGSVVFHLFSPWWWTPIATNWRYIDDTINITFWITGAVFFAVIAFMAYCVFRFHHKEGRQAAYNPENKKLEWWLTIVTAIGVGAMPASWRLLALGTGAPQGWRRPPHGSRPGPLLAVVRVCSSAPPRPTGVLDSSRAHEGAGAGR